MTASVRSGVFFEVPEGLPRGPHQLSREQVQGAQRQRLLVAYIQASVEGYLGALAADPVVARAFQLEMGSIGPKARERRRSASVWFADERLKTQERLRKHDPLLRSRPLSSHLAAILGMRELACDALETSQEPDFMKLAPELVDWVVTAWYDELPSDAPAARRSPAVRKPARRRASGAAAS